MEGAHNFKTLTSVRVALQRMIHGSDVPSAVSVPNARPRPAPHRKAPPTSNARARGARLHLNFFLLLLGQRPAARPRFSFFLAPAEPGPPEPRRRTALVADGVAAFLEPTYILSLLEPTLAHAELAPPRTVWLRSEKPWRPSEKPPSASRVTALKPAGSRSGTFREAVGLGRA